MAWAAGSRPFCCVAVQRLKTRAQFQAVLAGQRVASTTHFVLHRCKVVAPASALAPQHGDLPSTGGVGAEPAVAAPVRSPAPLFSRADAVWLGAMVPKRWARRAVTRNTIKRQIYAAGDFFEARLPAAAHVVRLRTAFDRKTYVSATSEALKQVVRQELEQLLARGVASGRAALPARDA